MAPSPAAFWPWGVAALLAHVQVFSPGQPDDHGLFLAANLAGLLLILAGWQARSERAARLWLVAAGAAGGFGLWLDAGTEMVALGALVAGGLTAAGLAYRPPTSLPRQLPWRAWATSGAGVAVLGWLIDGRPGGFVGINPGQNHPLLKVLALARPCGGTHGAAAAPGFMRGKATRIDGIFLAAAAFAIGAPLAWLFHHGGGADFGPNHPALAGRGSLFAWWRGERL